MAAPRISGGDWGRLLALSILWGGSFLYIALAVREIPPFTLVAARVIIAALALHLILRLTGDRSRITRTAILAFFGMGLLNNVVPFSLMVWGQQSIASGLAAILNATTPLFAVLVAHIATKDEKLSAARVAGVLIGFAGVAVMVGGDVFATQQPVVILAQIAVLAASFSYAVSGVYGRRIARLGLTPLAGATGQLTASSVMMLPLALLVDQPWSLAAPGLPAVAALLALALVSTALAYVLFFRILSTAGATNLSLVTLLIPVTATLLGALVLGERLGPKHALGMALIAAGLGVLDGRPLGWLKARLGMRTVP